MGEAVALGDVVRVFEPHALVIGTQRAVPLVEAMIRWPAAVFRTNVPLPEARRDISGLGKNFGDGFLPTHDAASISAQCDRVVARADRVAPRHQGRTRRRTLWFNDVVRQLGTFFCEVIHAFGVRTSEYPAAVAAEFAHAKIVDMEEEDVWFSRWHR